MNTLTLVLLALVTGAAFLVLARRVFRRGEKLTWLANTFPEAGTHEDSKTFLTDAAITVRHLLYKQGSDVDHIAVLTGANDVALGTVPDEASAAEERVALKLLGKGGTTRMVSDGTVTANGRVYQTAAGKVASTGSVFRGFSLTAGSVDGDVVEVVENDISSAAGVGYGTGAGGAVTQITSASTGVTLNKVTGQITTVALTTAAAAEEAFVLTNSQIAATDVVAVSTTYAGGGTPVVSVKGVAAGSCTIVITNLAAAAALDAVLVVNFAVIKAVAA